MKNLYGWTEFAIGFVLLVVITGLVFISAVMRFAGNPVIWSIDVAQLLFIWLCFLGAAHAMRKKAHLGVDYLVKILPYRVRLGVETLLSTCFIVFLLTLAVVGFNLTMLNWERAFGDSGVPYAWVTIAVPVGSIFLSISILTNLIGAWRTKDTLIYTRTDDMASQEPEMTGGVT